ncbi:glycosyltransferase family 2 protein [bacterium]|nr:MAG: glycosyltransferase family 2 protein [bacterium]
MSTVGKILIVVPCLNEEAHLPDLLDWLRSQSEGAVVVVADGGSTDASRAIVEARQSRWQSLHLLDNPERLQSAGVNKAVAAYGAGCQWLVRIDAHAAYPDNYVQTLLSSAERQGAESVVVPMATVGASCFQRAVAAAQNSVLGTGGSAHRHIGAGKYVDHGHHALMRLDAFNAVGGYDRTFSHNEDAEIDYRLTAAGYRIWLEPRASLTYFPRATLSGLWRQYRNFGKGRARTIQKHRIKPRLRQMLPVGIAPIVVAAALAAPLCLASLWALILALPFLGWSTICLLAGVVLAVRSRSLCLAATGIALMTMHSAWSLGFWSQIATLRQADG